MTRTKENELTYSEQQSVTVYLDYDHPKALLFIAPLKVPSKIAICN